MKRVLQAGAVALACVPLAGCMAPRIEAGRYVVDYNRAVEAEANETTLLNILRSSFRAPTHYTSVQSVNGQMSASRSSGVEVTPAEGAITRVVGAGGVQTSSNVESSIGGRGSLSLTVAQQPTYSVVVLNTPDFTRGTSSPINQATFNNFLAEGYPEDLLLPLFVETMEIIDPAATGNNTLRLSEMRPRRPDSDAGSEAAGPNCANQLYEHIRRDIALSQHVNPGTRAPMAVLPLASVDAAQLASLVQQGLSFRQLDATSLQVLGPRSPNEVQMRTNIAEIERQIVEVADGQAQPDFAEMLKTTAGPALAAADLHGDRGAGAPSGTTTIASLVHRCMAQRGTRVAAASDAATANSAAVADDAAAHFRMQFTLRSPDGVVYAVGEYVRRVRECRAARPASEHSECDYIRVDGVPLFSVAEVLTEGEVEGAMVETEYLGQRWAVLRAGAGEREPRTMQVINIIQKLINLNKVSSELRTPTIIQTN